MTECIHDWKVGTLYENWDFNNCEHRKETFYYIYYVCPKCDAVKRVRGSETTKGPKCPVWPTSNILGDWLKKLKS